MTNFSKRVLVAGAVVLLASGGRAVAQTATKLTDVTVAPIECWWKTDRNAVRIGEHFQLTLTCAVVDTEKVKVVVDESSLAPAALHLVPFEIISGQRFRDIMNSPRRFFQYQYTMRVLGEDFFGKEVSLPRLQLTYRVQNALNGGTALAGREAQYSLRPVPIRVLSLVPTGANDIRDTPPDTFGDVDARLFRSNLLMITAGVALTLAALLLVYALIRATVKMRASAAVKEKVVSPFAVLRAASRELGSVQAASQGGWNGDLAGRAASAVRLAGAVALGKPVGRREVDRSAETSEGQIVLGRGVRGKKVVLSSSVTSDSARPNASTPTNGSDAIWQGLSQVLGTFTAVRYSRNGTPDGTALDAALAESQDLVRRLKRRQLLMFGRSRPAAAQAAKQSWAR